MSPGARLVLLPLGTEAVSVLATSVLGDETSETSRELFRITGGNPSLVHEMLGAARTGASGAERLDERDLERLVPPRIVHSVQQRIHGVGGRTDRLAEAVAVLGEAPLPDVARLAALDDGDAVAAADRLAAADILSAGSPLRYVHPILRQALTACIPAARLSLLHARAARLLADVGAPLEQIAPTCRTHCRGPTRGPCHAACGGTTRGARRLPRDRRTTAGACGRRAATARPASRGHLGTRRSPGADPSP